MIPDVVAACRSLGSVYGEFTLVGSYARGDLINITDGSPAGRGLWCVVTCASEGQGSSAIVAARAWLDPTQDETMAPGAAFLAHLVWVHQGILHLSPASRRQGIDRLVVLAEGVLAGGVADLPPEYLGGAEQLAAPIHDVVAAATTAALVEYLADERRLHAAAVARGLPGSAADRRRLEDEWVGEAAARREVRPYNLAKFIQAARLEFDGPERSPAQLRDARRGVLRRQLEDAIAYPPRSVLMNPQTLSDIRAWGPTRDGGSMLADTARVLSDMGITPEQIMGIVSEGGAPVAEGPAVSEGGAPASERVRGIRSNVLIAGESQQFTQAEWEALMRGVNLHPGSYMTLPNGMVGGDPPPAQGPPAYMAAVKSAFRAALATVADQFGGTYILTVNEADRVTCRLRFPDDGVYELQISPVGRDGRALSPFTPVVEAARRNVDL